MGDPSDPSNFADRIRSWARISASRPNGNNGGSSRQPVLPLAVRDITPPQNLKTVNEKDVGKHPAGSARNGNSDGNVIFTSLDGAVNDINTHNNVADGTSSTSPPPAPPPVKSEAAGETDSTIENTNSKQSIPIRMKNGSKRFWTHTKEALTHSWVNVLLIFVPAGIIAYALNLNASIIFALNAIAIIPLAGLLAHATEAVATRLGDTLGALLNVSFGNAVELIIFIIALVKNEVRIVQASLIGSILSNLLLILGMAFTLGGLRYQEQIYNSTITQMSACLLSLSVISLVLPTAFHASFSDGAVADEKVLKVSRGTSVILLIVYVLYLLFQLKSHAYLYESTPQKIIDEESHPGILHDLMDSSSSSSDSDSSSNSDTDTSGSHTTTKRIKRAFRNRRRRKSSASSITPSLPSVISSPSIERPGHQWESSMPATVSAQHSRRPSVLGAIASGDEADTDGEDNHRGGSEPRVRDFVQQLQAQMHQHEPERKPSKKHKKRHHKHRRHDDRNEDVEEGSSIRKGGKKSKKEASPPKVGFADDVQFADIEANESPKKPFGGIRQLSRGQSFRPALPKMLSQNVFVSPPPASNSPALSAMRPAQTGLRRTNSLPDRLNRQGTAAPAARAEGLYPYPQRPVTRASSGLANETDDDDAEKPPMSRTAATVLLLFSTALVAVCAEFMVEAIPDMLTSSAVSQTFIGLIILPIVSNAAEHVTAVTVAAKNKMDLAIGVSVGSSIQIALFVTPLVVILGWIMGRDMSLYFTLFETVSLFVTAFVVNFLVLDGRSNYLEGALLMSAYVIIA